MRLHINERILNEVFGRKEVVAFVRKAITDSYVELHKGHEQEVAQMVDKAFKLLVESNKKDKSIENLQETAENISRNIFHTDDKAFWFNTDYKNYKLNIRPDKDLAKIEKFINGKTILDYGSGGGYLALRLENKNYSVYTTDVLDYRTEKAFTLPFKKITEPDKIPDFDMVFDVIIAKTTFHHIESKYTKRVINDLSRKGKRLVIEEDIYAPTNKINGFDEAYAKQPLLRDFLRLAPEDQKRCLILNDFFSNNIALAVSDISCPFEFKTMDEWRVYLEKNGWLVKDTVFSGYEDGKMHRTCQAWIICESKNI